MEDNTIFDSVFKTMLRKTPELIVPFINESFGRSYPLDAEIVQFTNEHETPHGSIVDDSVFRLGDKIYHIECQSTPDTSMVVRMIEYDFNIALEEAITAGPPYEMDFPASCVLFLRDTPSTPDTLEMKVNLPNGDFFMYRSGVVKAQSYTSDDIFEKRLLILAPYYLMRYEKELGRIAGDRGQTDKLLIECREMREQIESLTLGAGQVDLYESLVELIIRVSDYVLKSYEDLRKKVRAAMGGEVLELLGERSARLQKEAEARGVEKGTKRGIEQGIEALAAQLEAQGMDREAIDKAVKAAKEQRAS